MSVTLRYTLTEEDYVSFNIDYHKLQRVLEFRKKHKQLLTYKQLDNRALNIFIPMILITVSIYLFGSFNERNFFGLKMIILVPYLFRGILIVLFRSFFYWDIKRTSKKKYPKVIQYKKERESEVVINDTEVVTEDERHDFKELLNVYITNDYIYFYYEPKKAVVVPKVYVVESEELMHIIMTKLSEVIINESSWFGIEVEGTTQ